MDEFVEDFDPLCSIPSGLEWTNISSDWVIRKVDEIEECVGMSCEGSSPSCHGSLSTIFGQTTHF